MANTYLKQSMIFITGRQRKQPNSEVQNCYKMKCV